MKLKDINSSEVYYQVNYEVYYQVSNSFKNQFNFKFDDHPLRNKVNRYLLSQVYDNTYKIVITQLLNKV